MQIKQEFWATPRSSNILLLMGVIFFTILPLYSLINLGTSISAIVFTLLLCIIPGIHMINCSRKIKAKPILIVTGSEITIQAPFNASKTVSFTEIKSIEEDINQGIILKSHGRFSSSRIPAKMLSITDREKLLTLLKSAIGAL